MTADEATAYLGGDEYRRDPFGPSFDPGVMLAVLRSGTPESRWFSPQTGRVPNLRLAADRAADALLDENPMALLIGMLPDQEWMIAVETPPLAGDRRLLAVRIRQPGLPAWSWGSSTKLSRLCVVVADRVHA